MSDQGYSWNIPKVYLDGLRREFLLTHILVIARLQSAVVSFPSLTLISEYSKDSLQNFFHALAAREEASTYLDKNASTLSPFEIKQRQEELQKIDEHIKLIFHYHLRIVPFKNLLKATENK